VPSTTLDLPPSSTANDRGVLAFVERLGNRLPEPWLLFVYGLVIVLILSKIAALQRWSIEAKVLDAGKVVTQTLVARDLLSADRCVRAVT
jgi:aminobenzoyl-glutamate transport protein